MENENKKNYYNLLKGQIQICEVKKDKKLKKQWKEDIEFAKKELEEKEYNKPFEDCYYEFFVNGFLVKAIERIIINMKRKSDFDKKNSIRLFFRHGRVEALFESFDCCGGWLYVPTIDDSSSVVFDSYENGNEILSYHFEEFFDKMCRNISVYTEISTSSKNWAGGLVGNRHGYGIEKDVTFNITLKDLIDMYYMEKQRQEYENHDAREIKK